MKVYIGNVLRKEKKAISFEKLCSKIEELIRQDNELFVLSSSDIEEIRKILEEECENYRYYKTPNDEYILLSKTSFRKGRFYGNRAGEGFVISTYSYTNKEGDLIVKEEKTSVTKENCNGAIDGDIVLVDVGGNGRKPKIEKIIDRTLGEITGEIIRIGGSYFVKPLDKKKQNLTIALMGDYIEGEIVSVALEERREGNFYIGRIVDTFRHKDDPHMEAKLEAFKCGMPEGFSSESFEQLKTIPTHVREEDKVGRCDFTDWEIFSIDGVDTKDKDDCISFFQLPNGHWLLGDHIADPPYYVPTGSPIHKDAFRKGTSYYFGGCVEPQLPRKLSNGICSLYDGVDRLCKSMLVEYDEEGNVVSRKLVRSVIHSDMGMNYHEVNRILREGTVPKDYPEQYQKHKKTLEIMSRFAKQHRAKRIKNGAIEFFLPEKKFIYDEKGKAIDITFRREGEAEDLIKEFMLAGNINLFEMFTEMGIPCPYRVHGLPNNDRLREYLRLLKAIGMPFSHGADDVYHYKTFMQELSEHIRDSGPLYPMLCTNLIRCFSHAFYSTDNIGHYGLGLPTYGTFTSPDRRLEDDTVSRVADDCYFEEDPVKVESNIRFWKTVLPEYCSQASKMEKVEEDVERNVEKLDAVNMLSDHLMEEFEGIVISMTGNSMTIQLDNLIEGKVKVRDLPGDYYYNAETFTLLSLDGEDNYYIGDRLRLLLTSVDKDSKSIRFMVIDKIYENPIHDIDGSNQRVKTMIDEKKKSRRKKK